MNAYIEPEGCTLYCENCAPEGSEPYPDGGGESDRPQSCDTCHRFLENPLTSYGVQYVLDAARGELARGRAAYNTVHACYNGTYYEGCRHVEIVRDWMEQLQWYSLNDKDTRFVEKFLSWTADRA